MTGKRNFYATFICLYLDPEGPEIDLGFAISVAPGVAQENLKLVKETVQEMIDRYNVGRVRYGFIVFGSSAVLKIPFTDHLTDPADLKKAVDDELTSALSSPNLDAALDKAETLFNGSKRDQAKKILIVIMDKKSPSEPSSVKVRNIDLLSCLGTKFNCEGTGITAELATR